jgi:small subunit ribosomal protein S16
MVKIRLARRGKKNEAYYHIVVLDSRKKRDGAVLATIGTYNPRALKASEKFTLVRTEYDAWMAKGAQPTETVVQVVNSSTK